MHVSFPAGTDPLTVVAVHPTQIYETILMFLAFLYLWRLRTHGHGLGWRFGVYLVLAGVERFLIEFVRAKDDRVLGVLSIAQLTSVVVVLVGVGIMYQLRAPGPPGMPTPARFLPRPAPAPAT
jgi:phosphatidylglycerol:prolipoprotein diacylglycerol transferase